MAGNAATPQEFFAGHPHALGVWERVHAIIDEIGPVDVRTTKSQIAFVHRRGFAYLWMPGRWLTRPTTEVVLSIARDHEVDSPRFKEIAHPSAHIWMHHLEVHSPEDLDDEVRRWLAAAWAEAA